MNVLVTGATKQETNPLKNLLENSLLVGNITWNIDRTVTGSVADIKAPNIKHSTNGSLYMRYMKPPR